MANKPTLKTPKKKEINKVEDMWRATDLQTERTKLLYFKDLVASENPYPLNDMEDMIASIKDHGIEQNLVVKEQRDGTFKIITGHRHYNAIKSIIEDDNEGDYQYLSEIYCKVIPLEEDDIITNLRLHETNFENRILLKLPEEDKRRKVWRTRNKLNYGKLFLIFSCVRFRKVICMAKEQTEIIGYPISKLNLFCTFISRSV